MPGKLKYFIKINFVIPFFLGEIEINCSDISDKYSLKIFIFFKSITYNLINSVKFNFISSFNLSYINFLVFFDN